MNQHISILAVALILAACGGGGYNSSKMVTANTALKAIADTDTNPRPEDFDLSCAEVEQRLANVQARYDELAAEQKRKNFGQNLLSGLVTSTVSLMGTSAAATAGSAESIHAAGMAKQVAVGVSGDLVSMESDAEQL